MGELAGLSNNDLYKAAALAEGYSSVPVGSLISQNGRVAFIRLYKIAVRFDGMVCVRKPGRGNQPFRWVAGAQDPTGYRHVCLRLYHRRQMLVHRLIAEAFIANPENKPTVDHINRVRDDNRVENLRWATVREQSENSASVLFRKPYSVRYCEDPAQYSKEYCKEYHALHREERKAKRKVFQEAHKELLRAQKRAWYAAHKEQVLAGIKKWRLEHKDEFAATQRRYRQRKALARSDHGIEP